MDFPYKTSGYFEEVAMMRDYFWSVVSRCEDEGSRLYKDYGGKGITVCDRWRNSFEQFFEDMGFWPTRDHVLKRIDKSKEYSKENCYWAEIKNSHKKKPKIRAPRVNGMDKIISFNEFP